MINFDSLTLKALLNEIAPILISGRVQKVQQPSRKELLLNIRAQRASHKLYFNIDPKYPHLTILSKEGEELRGIKNPHKPPMFCMLLRKHMEGAKILDIKQPDNERIIEIYFESYSEIGERSPLCLTIELMGKHSNIILYNHDTNIILGCAHNISSEKSREREVAGTLPYIYPPGQQKTELNSRTKYMFYNMAKIKDKPFCNRLNSTFYDISYALADEVCNYLEIETKKDTITAISEDKILKAYELLLESLNLKNIEPSISNDFNYFSINTFDKSLEWIKQTSVNQMVDMYFAQHIYKDNIAKIKSSLLEPLKREIKKNKTKTNKHLKKIQAEDNSENYRQLGDIVMANLYIIKPGAESIKVENPYKNNEKEVVKLDPTINANANAQKYYKLYSKAKNAAKISREILRDLEKELSYLEEVKLFIETADSMTSLNQLREELESEGIVKQKKQLKKLKKELIELDYKEIDGFRIYIGKNNKQNDYLVTKLASGKDIWLHTHEIPGSHILIKLPPENIEPSDETIYKAARLAAQYSQAKNSTKVPVIYTRKKHLKKPPGTKPGYFTYSNEKVIIVNQNESL